MKQENANTTSERAASHYASSVSLTSVSIFDDAPVRASGETATNFETADLSTEMASSGEAPMPSSASANASDRPTAKTGRVGRDASIVDDSEQRSVWRLTSAGVPGWLASLVIHLSVVLILALVSVSGGGRGTMEMLATATENDEIEPYMAVDVTLDPAEIEPVTEQLAMPSATKLTETSDLDPILDTATLHSGFEVDSRDRLFEQMASAGLSESDLRQQKVAGRAKFFGVDGQGSNFVFIVDCSGSMADYGRWRRAVRELKKSIEDLDRDQRFLILLYNDGFIAMNDEAKLVKSTKRQQQKAFRWLNNNVPNSWTFCAQALAKALRLQPDAIFLLSDGEFNDRQDVFLVLDRLNSKSRARQYRRQQIPVHTIALGSHQGQWTMKQIADQNSGLFRLVE